MRVLYMGNNELAVRALPVVFAQDEVVGLVVHPQVRSSNREEIERATGVGPDVTFEAPVLEDVATLRAIADLRPDVVLSVKFGYVLRRPFLDLFPGRVLNLHTSLLPFNRGAYPNVWSIVEGTPAGVTLHVVDEGVDTGPVLAQREVSLHPWDTGKALYDRLDEAALDLLAEAWPAYRAGTLAPRAQEKGGTSHWTDDVASIDEIELERTYEARRLIDVLRARTFPPHRGVYFRTPDGRRVFLRLDLEPEPASPEEGQP